MLTIEHISYWNAKKTCRFITESCNTKAGRLPYDKVGGHHQFRLRDIIVYEQQLKAESLEARQALADEAQRLGLDD